MSESKPTGVMGFLRMVAPPVGALFISLLLGFASLWIFSRNNDFPLNCQPEEVSKAGQVLSDNQRRNFNHPLLILESANVVRQWFHVPSDDLRQMVVAGRWTSAGLGAIGVFALALAGYWGFGYRGLLLSGTIVALCPQWLVYAHYFKEDAALAVGVAITVLGLAWVVNAKRLWQQLIGSIILGLGCATATSGKYVGVMVLPTCLLALFLAPAKRWWWRLVLVVLFLVSTVAVFAGINARAFESFWPVKLAAPAVDRMEFDYNHAITGHYGVTLPAFNFYLFGDSCQDVMAHLWVFFVLGLGLFLARRRFSRWGIVLAALAVTITLTLCFDTIPFRRYALPLTIVLYFAAGQAMAFVLGLLRDRAWVGNVILACCVVVVVVLQGLRCANFDRQFGDDSRQRVRVWIPQNLPPNSVLAGETYCGLEQPDRWNFPRYELGMQVRGRNFTPCYVADLADSAEHLADSGVDYAVVSSQSYGRFFIPGLRSTPDRPGYAEGKREFYEGLFARGELVWSSAPSVPTDSYTNPEIRIYRISQLRGSSSLAPVH